MNEWYVGYDKNGVGNIFTSDDPLKATPESSGYDSVDGPFSTKEEAESLIE